MDKKYKGYQKQIKKEHRFGFWNNPSFEEFIELPIKKLLFLPLAEKVLGLLGWEVVLKEDDKIYARSKEKWGIQGKITIAYLEYSKIRIFSESALDQRWDNGKNSVRVKLFIKVFHEEFGKLSLEEKEKVEKEFSSKYNWEDYEIPAELPKPSIKKQRIIIPVLGSLLSVLILSALYGLIDYKVIEGNNGFKIFNLPVLSELVIAIILWFNITRLSRLGNYTDLRKLRVLSLISFGLFFLFTEIIFYLLLSYPWVGPNEFLDFIMNYYEPFFTQEDPVIVISTLLLSIFFILMIGYNFWLHLVSYISMMKLNRIPTEVVEFVYYLGSKNKSEIQIRYELSKKGWDSEQVQNEVFEAIEGNEQVRVFAKGYMK